MKESGRRTPVTRSIMNTVQQNTPFGIFTGTAHEGIHAFLGIPYGRAKRFEYCERIDTYSNEVNATEMGNSCPQYRQFYPHLDVRERLFYHKEFREGIPFHYDEDCLNLNIYAPEDAQNCPVIVYFHGGGFNSGSSAEEPFRVDELAKRGVITVFANYRVGILGYFSHEEIQKKYGRNGNFGLDDQVQAIRWVKEHIAAFGGDPNNITVMGQSAGAISMQYLCLNHDLNGLFQKAVLMSGGGKFPKMALPKQAEETYDYWQLMMELAGCKTFEEFQRADLKVLHDAYENIIKIRKDSINNMMPVIDGYLIKDEIGTLIQDPLELDYMIGYTNNDIYAPVLAYIGNRFAKDNGAYVYYFDIDAPGDDNNGAFHSCDLRYMFGRLQTSWRPYGQRDYEVSKEMMDYLANFVRSGNPNGAGLPQWDAMNAKQNKVLCFRPKITEMGHPSYFKLTFNLFSKGDPKA